MRTLVQQRNRLTDTAGTILFFFSPSLSLRPLLCISSSVCGVCVCGCTLFGVLDQSVRAEIRELETALVGFFVRACTFDKQTGYIERVRFTDRVFHLGSF